MPELIAENINLPYPARSAWLGLVAGSLGFLSFGVVFHLVPPILPVVVLDLGIGHGTAGLLMSLFALPGILLSLPGGWLVDRFGERAIGGGGLIVMGLGTLLMGLAPTVPLILAARVLSGIGAMIGIVALQRLVIRLFTGRGLGLPLGVSGSAIPLGIVLVLSTAGPWAGRAGWRTVALGAGGLTIGIGLVFLAAIWAITRGHALGRPPGRDEQLLANRHVILRPIWIAGGVWFCANGAMTAFMTFAPDHFRELGFDLARSGRLASVPMWTSAALGIGAGWLTDRYGGRAVAITTGMALMGLSLLLLPTAIAPPVVIGLALGLSLALVVTPTLALPGALLPGTHTGRGFGILATCANLGVFCVPPVAGLLRDTSGGYFLPFVLAGATAMGGAAVGVWLWRGGYTPGVSWRG